MFLTPIVCKALHRVGCGEQQDPGPPMLSTIKSGISTGNLPPDLREAEVTQWPHVHSQCRVGRGVAQREHSPPHLSIFASLSLWASVRYSPKYLDVLTPFSSHELLRFKVHAMLTFPSYRWGDWDPEKLRSLLKITCYDQQPQGSHWQSGPRAHAPHCHAMQPLQRKMAFPPTRLETPALFPHFLFPLSVPLRVQIWLISHICSLFCILSLLSRDRHVLTDVLWEKFLTDLPASRLLFYNKLSWDKFPLLLLLSMFTLYPELNSKTFTWNLRFSSPS